MSGFQNHFIGRKSKVQVHQALGFTLKVVELLEKFFRVACLKVVVALLDFVLMEDVAVSENVFAGSVLPLGVDKVENIVAVLKIHCQTFKTVCNFSGNRLAFQAADLLEDVPGAQARCRDCLERLDRGEELAQAVRQSEVLPPAECRLLALGLRSGSGDRVMEDIARRLGQAGEDALEDRVSQVEPALVGVTSVLVGVILLSVMLPLMHIMSAIG